jgi:streptogramin lyase
MKPFGSLLIFACAMTTPVLGGVWEDLGQPVVGAWRQGAWVHWDPVLQRDLLWSQECSQDGAVLYAMDLHSGQVLEELDVPAREINDILSTPDGMLYIGGVSGLTQPGNELIRFNPHQRKLERLGLPGFPRNRIASLMIGRDGNVYVGTHQEGRLFRFRVEDAEWDELGQMVPSPIVPGQNVWLSNLRQLADGTILASVVRSPNSQVVAIDPENGEFHVVMPTESGGHLASADGILESELDYRSMQGGDQFGPDAEFSVVSAIEGAGVLLRVDMDLVRADLTQRRLQRLATLPFSGTLLPTTRDEIVVFDRQLNRFAVVDLRNGSTTIHQSQYQGKRGTQICGLSKASDGSIYGTNIIGMHIFRYDPGIGRTQDLGHVGWSGGEVYNTIDHEGRIFFGTYGGGYWGVYDPTKPWKPDLESRGASPDANPRNLGQLGGADSNAVNRPFEYVSGPNGKIYVAARANYRTPGGSLVEFDPQSNSMRVFRDLKRSIQTVTADSRYIFAGTNIHGGRGSGIRAEVATLIVHDPDTGTRVFEQAIVPDSKSIVCLRYNALDNRVYGSTDNQVLFAFDPRSFRLLAAWPIRSPGSPLAGVPEDVGIIHLTVASDGNVYGVTSQDVFRLDVTRGVVEYLDPPPIPDLYQIVEGAPGEFFIGARTHLLKYTPNSSEYFR